mmetsp:Transcript_4943/g.14565  ORF Transcript_4943/g.14565 Transcript_4943/m.14565 type:complete len:200 (+) Transcript_4943:610-1209(+)
MESSPPETLAAVLAQTTGPWPMLPYTARRPEMSVLPPSWANVKWKPAFTSACVLNCRRMTLNESTKSVEAGKGIRTSWRIQSGSRSGPERKSSMPTSRALGPLVSRNVARSSTRSRQTSLGKSVWVLAVMTLPAQDPTSRTCGCATSFRCATMLVKPGTVAHRAWSLQTISDSVTAAPRVTDASSDDTCRKAATSAMLM